MKKRIGFLAGLAVCAVLFVLRIPGMPYEGQKCLALSLMAVIWWATGAMHPGYSSLALLVGFALFLDKETVPNATIFSIWTSPTMYLVISGFLIAEAVRSCGLGRRIALFLLRRFVHTYTGIILACYGLGLLLSFLIPHPWPRSFLIISIMEPVIASSGWDKKYAVNVGLAVFAGSIPSAMVLLTGDSTLNPVVAGFAQTSISWLQWVLYMGLPGLVATVLTCSAQLLLFPRPRGELARLDTGRMEQDQAALPPLSRKEISILVIIALAVILWATDSIHGIPTGWVAVLAVILLACPLVDGINAKSFQSINLGTLLFLAAALSIGTVGAATGMNDFLVEKLLPAQAPASLLGLTLLIFGICMVLHMALGSTLAVLSIASPALIAFGTQAGFSPIVPALLCYTTISLHWLLPFHHMNILVGVGEGGGGYGNGEVLKLGLAQTVVTFLIVLLETVWWQAVGLV